MLDKGRMLGSWQDTQGDAPRAKKGGKRLTKTRESKVELGIVG